MTEDDTFNILKASKKIQSLYGGYYFFVPDYRVRSSQHPGQVWGHLYCHGNIHDIIKGKTHQGQEFEDWLSTSYKLERMIGQYTAMCEIYARHITVTHPEPGTWWKWKE